jgi:Kef-type K+ transport system membrane component KefB/mannitol/fructose-specific phosphotransferase system IIA component (Ntr-type)
MLGPSTLNALDGHDTFALLFGLGMLLCVSRAAGALARRLRQPAVLVEILAGLLLGPTVFGRLAPGAAAALFPPAGPAAAALDAIATLSLVLFMLVAGMEVDLTRIARQGRSALVVGLAGLALPFALGLGVATLAPEAVGREPGADPLVFALFLATALSISALPVIAKSLRDVGLYRSNLGMLVLAAAMVDDLVGWLVFGLVLGLMDATRTPGDVLATVAMTLGFFGLMLTLGRLAFDRALRWLAAGERGTSAVLLLALVSALFGAAFTEWMGVHAVFGAFLVGVALGDSRHLREHTHAAIDEVISSVFAPLFFVWIGLRVDLVAGFDAGVTALLLLVACAGKIVGVAAAGRRVGLPAREALAVGFGLNARGAMGIVLSLLALRAGVIGDRLFVSLVIVAIITSLMSGPAMQALLRRRQPLRLADHLAPGALVAPLPDGGLDAALRALAGAVAPAVGQAADAIVQRVLERERTMSTGLEHGVAVPHARLPGLGRPVVGVGISPEGVDFDAPDGHPAHLVVLILSAPGDDRAQIELMADAARVFADERRRERGRRVRSLPELLELLREG